LGGRFEGPVSLRLTEEGGKTMGVGGKGRILLEEARCVKVLIHHSSRSVTKGLV